MSQPLSQEQFTEYMDGFAKTVKQDFDEVGTDLQNVKSDLKGLKQGQEDITLRLTNVAYRFEVEELKQRIKILEEKAGIKV